MPCLPHDMAMEFFMGVSALFHRIVPSSDNYSMAMHLHYYSSASQSISSDHNQSNYSKSMVTIRCHTS